MFIYKYKTIQHRISIVIEIITIKISSRYYSISQKNGYEFSRSISPENL